MTVLTMGPRDEGFLISEANGSLSRDTVLINQGLILASAGTVLHKADDGVYKLPQFHAAAGEVDAFWDSADAVLLRNQGLIEADTTIPAAAITRFAEVDASGLVFPELMTSEFKAAAIAELAAKGIIAR